MLLFDTALLLSSRRLHLAGRFDMLLYLKESWPDGCWSEDQQRQKICELPFFIEFAEKCLNQNSQNAHI